MMPYCNPMLANRKREKDVTSASYFNYVSHIFDGKGNTSANDCVETKKGDKNTMKIKDLKEKLYAMCNMANDAMSNTEDTYTPVTEQISKILDDYKKLKKKNKKLKKQLEEAKFDLERERNSEFDLCM